MQVYIEQNPLFYPEIKYTWDLFCKNKGIQYTETTEASADIRIGSSKDFNFTVSKGFYELLKAQVFEHTVHFTNECLIYADDKPDYLSTAFYMVNSLQEYGGREKDEIGRFPYEKSYQYRFQNITENLVQQYFDAMAHQLGINERHTKSKVFLTHDVDSLYGLVREEISFMVKQVKPYLLLPYLAEKLFLKPHLRNVNKMLASEEKRGLKSTFFWLVNKGRISKRELNSDYDFHSREIQDIIKTVEGKGFKNAFHKSISKESFQDEMQKLGFDALSGRYHYLKFALPRGYDEIEHSGLKLDCSLGFAAHYGFRNSYGLPFKPYNLKERKAYTFLEVPLHIMDGTFQQYMHIGGEQTLAHITAFLNKNRNNCVITMLWHPTFYSCYKYGEYRKAYNSILEYIAENGFEAIDESTLLAG